MTARPEARRQSSVHAAVVWARADDAPAPATLKKTGPLHICSGSSDADSCNRQHRGQRRMETYQTSQASAAPSLLAMHTMSSTVFP